MSQPPNFFLYSFYEEQAKQRIAMRDINDWTIVALALTLDCPIWTEDTNFFGAGVATWTSDHTQQKIGLKPLLRTQANLPF